MTEPIRVLIADDHSLVRAGFQSVLSIESDITVVGEARNGAEAVTLARDEAPDVVLMDIRMPELDGLEATRLITSDPRLRRTRVVVLTTFDLDEYVFGALQAGASGFLLKGAEPAVLIEAVRTVARGDALLEPGATRRLIEAYVHQQHADQAPPTRLALPDSLTSRELEILALIAGGLTNSEIAARLFISPLTCKSHVSRILTKLDARDRTQLVVIAYESGLVVPGQPHTPSVPSADRPPGTLTCALPGWRVAQGDLVGLGYVVGLERSQPLAQALASLPQQFEGIGGGTLPGSALGVSPVFLDEMGLQGCGDFVGRLQRVINGPVP